MPSLLQAITEDKYQILQSVDDAAIVIKNTKEPPLSLTIHLTSPVVREEMEKVLAGGRGAETGLACPHFNVLFSFRRLWLKTGETTCIVSRGSRAREPWGGELKVSSTLHRDCTVCAALAPAHSLAAALGQAGRFRRGDSQSWRS